MSQVIVYTNNNGGVSVCVPTGEMSVEEVQAKDIPAGITSYVVDISTLPTQDQDFFNAWELSGTNLIVNINKAKELTKNRLRIEREPLLQQQDILFQRALETGTDTLTIVVEKQRLRDITKLADDATTLDQLRAIQCKSS